MLNTVTELRSIDGGKTRRAKTMAAARVLVCKNPSCHGNRGLSDNYIGRMVDGNGRAIFKGTRIAVCSMCRRPME